MDPRKLKFHVSAIVHWFFGWGLALFMVCFMWGVYRLLVGHEPDATSIIAFLAFCVLANIYNIKFQLQDERLEALLQEAVQSEKEPDVAIKVPVEILESAAGGQIVLTISKAVETQPSPENGGLN
jgi:hypothetical protein